MKLKNQKIIKFSIKFNYKVLLGAVLLIGIIFTLLLLLVEYTNAKNDRALLSSEIAKNKSNIIILQNKIKDIEKLKKENKSQSKKIDDQAKLIKDIQDKISELESKSNFSVVTPPASNNETPVTTPQANSTIYDRINVGEAFKPQVVRALNLIQAKAPNIYGILNEHVTEINDLAGFCGGWQLARPIFIGDCDLGHPDSIVASIIIHESYHVYNVYALGVYSSGTAEQELPSYRQELLYADSLGVPDWYKEELISRIESYSE